MLKSTNKKSAWRGAFAVVLGTVSTLASANTFVYVSNAEDGDISSYQLSDTGRLIPGPRTPAAKLVMPMAASTDGRYLYAASRTKPFQLP
jgi:6-phosphogluconolactonase